MYSLRSIILFSFFLSALTSINTNVSSAAHPYSVSRYRTPYSPSAYYRYRYGNRSAYYGYSNRYARNYSYYPRSSYYGFGARRYYNRYRPYAAVASYRYYRPAYYRFNGYPRYSYFGYNTFYPWRTCNAWNSYSSCYCSPYGYTGSYAPYWGTYTPLWGSYRPYWGGYFGGYYGPYCGIWPYRPTLYGSLIFQYGYNTGYGRRGYYSLW
ncbi:hypothetical protein [Gimesia aquarii]|uniref:hypothetical protein n=1 Tax=Gimesia aquarii TaxID=2527964 RepID=UPI00119D8847|nr:hypothetical protein [Gimesia aquarii]